MLEIIQHILISLGSVFFGSMSTLILGSIVFSFLPPAASMPPESMKETNPSRHTCLYEEAEITNATTMKTTKEVLVVAGAFLGGLVWFVHLVDGTAQARRTIEISPSSIQEIQASDPGTPNQYFLHADGGIEIRAALE